MAMVQETLCSGRWSMFTSPEVAQFEREFAHYVGARHAIFVNSCTSALLSCLLAHDIHPGAMVAVPDYTYIGSCMPIITLGATPVVVDIDPLTQAMCPASLLNAFEDHLIRAVIHPHLFGKATYAPEIAEICSTFGAVYISDCAQLLGDRSETAFLIELGLACFSFGDSKILRIGEGGAVATNSDELAERVRQARHEGESWLRLGSSRIEGANVTPSDVVSGLASTSVGLNLRPMAIAATVGRAMLPDVSSRLLRSAENAAILSDRMRHMDYFHIVSAGTRTWWTYPVLIKEGQFSRDVFLAALLAEGVPVGVHFPRLISSHPAVAPRIQAQATPRTGAESFSRQHFVLPIYPALQPEHMQLIALSIEKMIQCESLNSLEAAEEAQLYLGNARLSELCDGIFIFL